MISQTQGRFSLSEENDEHHGMILNFLLDGANSIHGIIFFYGAYNLASIVSIEFAL